MILIFVSSIATAQVDPDSKSTPRLRVGRISTGLRLDGKLDEPEWKSGETLTNLTMVEPREGVAPTEPTRVTVIADKGNLVIGVVCEDSSPSGIVSYTKSRDADLNREDYIRIVLDSFRDGRTGYIFAINAHGARYDALVPKPGEPENRNWDAVWEAATARSDEGWSAEIRIPVRSINFKEDLPEWGFNIERRVERLQEVSRWTAARRDFSLSQTARAGLLTELPDFDLGWGTSVQPSVTAGVGRTSREAASEVDADPSLDVTQLLGSNLLASVTVNTDFAETEVDTRQINLTRFPLFFPEKRTFFLEGADIFEFGLGLRTDLVPFFSRRIGLVEGQEVPIQLGGKLNGRVGNTNVGALAVHTGEEDDLVPGTNMGVFRVQRNVFSESTVGLLSTFGDPRGRTGSWLAGADFTYQTSRFNGDKNFLVGAWGLTMDRDDIDGGDKTAYGFKVDYPNDIWNGAFTYMRIGDSFRPSLGFVPRTGIKLYKPGIVYSPRPDWSWIRRMSHMALLRLTTDLDNVWETYNLVLTPINWQLESGDRFDFSIVPEGDRPPAEFEISEGVVIPPGTYHWQRYKLEGQLAPKRKLSGRVTGILGGFYDGTLKQFQLELSWTPTPLITADISGGRDVAELPWGDFDRNLIGTRIRLNFSPDLTVSSYIQYDNVTDSFGTNTRLRWTFRPLGDLFIIYNYNVLDLGDRFASDTNQLLIKLRYAFRR
jgi:hypothetical protein